MMNNFCPPTVGVGGGGGEWGKVNMYGRATM